MARLRIRIELSRGGLGVPLHKVASVMSKSQKFLDLLGEDVHIDRSNGEWLGFDFDRESLNFTAEYIGAVTAHQVEAFNAAFDGTTSLRRETIAQFAGITDAIGEDEIIGFGLYQTDENAEPTEWRCLSRRDALRIAEGIQLILGTDQESHLPAARDPGLAARIFGDRRDWGAEQGAWSDSLREVQRNLSNRLQRVENQVEQHSELIQDLRAHSATTETSFRNLLSSVEGFCDQATRRIESAAPLALPAWPAPAETPSKRSRRWVAAALALAVGVAILAAVAWPWPSQPAAATTKEPVVATKPAPSPGLAVSPAPLPPAPAISPVSPASRAPAASTAAMRVDLNATDPAWVSLVDKEGNKLLTELLVPGVPRTFEVAKSATLRTGNAGGLVVSVNGRPFGPLGITGQVREVQIKDGQILPSPK